MNLFHTTWFSIFVFLSYFNIYVNGNTASLRGRQETERNNYSDRPENHSNDYEERKLVSSTVCQSCCDDCRNSGSCTNLLTAAPDFFDLCVDGCAILMCPFECREESLSCSDDRRSLATIQASVPEANDRNNIILKLQTTDSDGDSRKLILPLDTDERPELPESCVPCCQDGHDFCGSDGVCLTSYLFENCAPSCMVPCLLLG